MEKNSSWPLSHTICKSQFIQLMNVNDKGKTKKLLEHRRRASWSWGQWRICLRTKNTNRTQKILTIKKRIDKRDYINIKTSAHQKVTLRVKWHMTEGKTYSSQITHTHNACRIHTRQEKTYKEPYWKMNKGLKQVIHKKEYSNGQKYIWKGAQPQKSSKKCKFKPDHTSVSDGVEQLTCIYFWDYKLVKSV